MNDVLALDFGLKRIGVALGSTHSGIAFSRDLIPHDDQALRKVFDLIESESVKTLLIGNPLKRDGEAGDIDEDLQHFVSQLRKGTDADIHLVDERYTSKIASQKLHHIDVPERQQRELKDSLAAQIILQQWLDQYSS